MQALTASLAFFPLTAHSTPLHVECHGKLPNTLTLRFAGSSLKHDPTCDLFANSWRLGLWRPKFLHCVDDNKTRATLPGTPSLEIAGDQSPLSRSLVEIEQAWPCRAQGTAIPRKLFVGSTCDRKVRTRALLEARL